MGLTSRSADVQIHAWKKKAMVLAVVASNEGKARWRTATMVEAGEEREQGRKAVKEGYGVGMVAATPDDEKRRRSTAGEDIRGRGLRRKSSRKKRPRRWRSLMRSTKPRRSTAKDPTTMEKVKEKRRQQGLRSRGRISQKKRQVAVLVVVRKQRQTVRRKKEERQQPWSSANENLLGSWVQKWKRMDHGGGICCFGGEERRREGGEAEVDGCGGSEEEGSIVKPAKREK